MKEPIIVGYDPGTTAAIAILDTQGKILFLKSKRNFKKGEIIDIITDTGKPLLLAGDRRPLPKNVEKMARTLGCKPFYPRKSLSVVEKNWIIRGFKKDIKDDHEKDALAAALHAVKHYSHVFSRTREVLESKGLSNLYSKVVESVMTGEVENIAEAVNKTLSEKQELKVPKIEEKVLTEKNVLNRTVSKLKEKIRQLEKDVSILKESNERLKRKSEMKDRDIRYYRKKLKEKVDLGYIETTKKKMEDLKNESKLVSDLVEKLKSFRKIESKGYCPIIEIEEIRDSVVKDIDENLDLEDRVILAENIENAQILEDYKIKVLISSEEPNKKIIEKISFPIITKKDISIEKMKNISVVKKQELEECIKKARKVGFVQFLEAHKKRRF